MIGFSIDMKCPYQDSIVFLTSIYSLFTPSDARRSVGQATTSSGNWFFWCGPNDHESSNNLPLWCDENGAFDDVWSLTLCADQELNWCRLFGWKAFYHCAWDVNCLPRLVYAKCSNLVALLICIDEIRIFINKNSGQRNR